MIGLWVCDSCGEPDCADGVDCCDAAMDDNAAAHFESDIYGDGSVIYAGRLRTVVDVQLPELARPGDAA